MNAVLQGTVAKSLHEIATALVMLSSLSIFALNRRAKTCAALYANNLLSS